MELKYNYQYYLHFKDKISSDAVLLAFKDSPDSLVEPVYDSSFSILSNSSFSHIKHFIATKWPTDPWTLILAKRISFRYRSDEFDLLDGCVKV